jgi:hypothetical protein
MWNLYALNRVNDLLLKGRSSAPVYKNTLIVEQGVFCASSMSRDMRLSAFSALCTLSRTGTLCALEVSVILTMEAAEPVTDPSPQAIEKALRRLKLTGRHEYAALEDGKGNYLQVAGGGVACMLERRSLDPIRHSRAFQEKRNKAFPDGTKLRFSGGEVALNSNEWFTIDQVVEAFLAFHAGRHLPDWIQWRDISDILGLPA